jgi:hypothetical protein
MFPAYPVFPASPAFSQAAAAMSGSTIGEAD